MEFTVTTFYKFYKVKDIDQLRDTLFKFGEKHRLMGLVLVSKEGINGTIAGTPDDIKLWKEFLKKHCKGITFKDSPTQKVPFKRWLVKIRESIVNIGLDGYDPDEEDDSHLTPDVWNEKLKDKDVVVLDTRNTYETEVGMFKNAIDPEIKTFQEFPEYVKNSKIDKDKTVLMYCTGGIRCEKASLEMKRQGYKNVYQLKGGILQYLKEHPNDQWEGECFVFDHRVAVDQNLNPTTKYAVCPHTGDPGDINVVCEVCGNHQKVRYTCTDIQKRTCSKDCATRLKRLESKMA